VKKEELNIFSLAMYNSLLFRDFGQFLPPAPPCPGSGKDMTLSRLRCLMREGQQWAGIWDS